MPVSMKTKAPSADRLTIRLFLSVGRRYKPDFYFVWLTPLSAICLSTLVPYFVGKILATLANPHLDVKGPFIGLAIAGAMAVIFNRIAFVSLLRWQANCMADLQAAAVEHLLYRGTSFHNNQVGGKLVSDAVDLPAAFLRLSDAVFTSILPFLSVVVVGISIVSIQAPLIGLTIFAMSALAIGSAIYFRMSVAHYRKKRMLAGKAVTAHIGDVITNSQTVKAFGREEAELRSHKHLNTVLLNTRLHDWGLLATNGNNRIIGLFAFELIFAAVIIHQVRHNPALLATGIFAFSYTVTLTNRLFDVGAMMRSVEEALLLAEPMTVLFKEQPEVSDAPDAKKLVVDTGKVTFEHVNFRYRDNSAAGDVFNNLDIVVEPGERVGLVGPSGGGKSTLTKLILRFEDIESGVITVDSQDISQVTQQSLRESIGYVAQEPLLFHRSVTENIAYGKPNATTEEIRDAADKAFALEFIQALPGGFDTIVGERGVKLSGGQRQRIAIARAFLKNAPILLLDEATSALDSESEQVIQKALWKLMEHKTTIVIAHRLSTIQKMDRIIVLENGRIVEQGPHAKLLEEDGLYARLWAHQSGGFIEE